MDKSVEELSTLHRFVRDKYEYLISEKISEASSIQKIISEISAYYECIINCMPGNVYWFDEHGRGIGCNQNVLDTFGFQSIEQFKGLTFEEMGRISRWSLETTEKFKHDTMAIFKSGQPRLGIKEPPLKGPDGHLTYFLTSRVPVFNRSGRVIAVVGISTDITKRQEAEEREKKALQEAAAAIAQAKEQEKFTQVASQVAHDIRSPLASLLMIIKSCTDIPEMERVALREAAMSIGDITNNLLNKYKPRDVEPPDALEEPQPVLLSAAFLQLLADKKFQYGELPVKFHCEFLEGSHFAFIRVEPSFFKRMMSNLINNAVEALERSPGTVTLKLDVTPYRVKITVSDNGKGMHEDLVQKILEKISVTEGKVNGHGIGLIQVQDTLLRNRGSLSIESCVGEGTSMIIEFPREKNPSWFLEEISLTSEDQVIILDDDPSIHRAWDTRFKSILKEYPQLELLHFEHCEKAIEYINSLSEEKKEKIFLLADFEFLKEKLNGLDVIDKTKIKRSLLVTSHYGNSAILNRLDSLKVKMLPKSLTAEIPISVEDTVVFEFSVEKSQDKKSVDVILVDDDPYFSNMLMKFIFSDYKVAYFLEPQQLLDSLHHYSKDVLIYLDNYFTSAGMRGIEVADLLYQKGFTKIHLLSGADFSENDLPFYLTALPKEDIKQIEENFQSH